MDDISTIEILTTEPILESKDNVRPLVYERPGVPGSCLIVSLDLNATSESAYLILREDGESGEMIARRHMGMDTEHWIDLISTVDDINPDERLIRIVTDEGIVTVPANLLLVNG